MFELEPGLIIWTMVSFGIMILVLYKIVLPPLLVFLAGREKMIADQIAQAEKNRKRAEETLNAQQAELVAARKKADQLLELARQEGEKQKQVIVGQAEKQAAGVLKQAQQELIAEKEKLRDLVKSEMAEYLAAAASKLMRRTYNLEEHRRLIEETVKEA